MGRFYKATPGQFIDEKMFDLPFAEMAAVMGQTDKNIDEAYEQGKNIQDSLTSKRLESDDPAVTERYKYFDDLAEESAAAMDKSPLSYKKYIGKLRRTSRELSTDLKTGVLGRAQEQYDNYNKIKEETGKRADLKQETKDVYADYLLKQYGSLDYNQKTGTFNKIKDSERNLKSEIVDENKFISEIGKNFEFKSVGRGGVGTGNMKGVDGKVIFTTSTSESVRTPERIRAVTSSELDAKDYLGSREQFYEMKQAIGDTSSDQLDGEGNLMSPQELAQRDKDSLIERAVTKLEGKKGHKNTSVKSLSSVTGKTTDQSNNYAPERRDNTGNKLNKAYVNNIGFAFNEMAKRGKLGAFTSADDMFNAVFTPTPGKTLQTSFKAANDAGYFLNNKSAYVNWVNLKAKSNAMYTPVSKGVVNTYKNRDQNQPVEGIYLRKSDNSREELPFNSYGELYENNKNGEYVYLPATGSVKSSRPTYSRDANGNLLGKTGAPLQGSDGKPTSDISQVIPEDLVVKYKDLPTYTAQGNLTKTTSGTLKQRKVPKVSLSGKVSTEHRLIETTQYYRIPSGGGPYELISLEFEVDPNTIPEITK